MIYTIDRLTDMIRLAMSRNRSPKALIRCRDPDTLLLDDVIAAAVPKAAQTVYTTAPISVIRDTAMPIVDEGLYWHHGRDGLYSGHILLPDDYLRLVIFEMSDWMQPVYQPLDATSAYYSAAISPYSGARGTPSRPVCTVTDGAEGQRLDFHSCHDTSAYITQAHYIPVPLFDKYGGINLDPKSIEQIISTSIELLINTSPWTPN